MIFNKKFQDKTVIVTGHTGFKGAWLVAWLKLLGARVVGIALDPPSNPSHFEAATLADGIVDLRIDVRDRKKISAAILDEKPDFLFHLAAQSLVRKSYDDPVETWETNLLGTINVLEALRCLDKPCSAVIVTSDKCYDNVEWVWGYRETDQIGGPDPYSASKGAAEIAIRSYIKSYFPTATSMVRIASARAGNVIGGGDWALNRIVPDCVNAWSNNDFVRLRNPYSTRPWQHVLEPLGGYLNLSIALAVEPRLHGEPFNFGPHSQQNYNVLDLVKEMSLYWDKVRWFSESQTISPVYESGLLKLNCDKALHYLGWHAVMEFKETVRMTVEWYRSYYENPEKILSITNEQIMMYVAEAKRQELPWTK